MRTLTRGLTALIFLFALASAHAQNSCVVATVTVNDVDRALDQRQQFCASLLIKGTETAIRKVVAYPNPGQQYTVTNSTTGGFGIVFSGSSGTTVTVLSGATMQIISLDGQNIVQVGSSGGSSIPSTTNLIQGSGTGNGADSGISPASILVKPTSTTDNPQSYGTTALGTQTLTPLSVLQNNAVNSATDAKGPFYLACGSWPGLWLAGASNVAGAFTSFVTCPLTGNTNFVKVCYTGSTAGLSGTEAVFANDLILQAAIAYPASTTVQQFSFGGKTETRMDRNAPLTCSDPLGFRAPSGTTTQAVINTFQRVPAAPTLGVSIPSTAQGSLAASTTYYYKATCLDYTGMESGGSTVQNATTTGTFLSVGANFSPQAGSLRPDNSVECSAYGLYRGTASTGPFNFVQFFPAAPSGNVRGVDFGIVAGSATVPTQPSNYNNAFRTNSSNASTAGVPFNQVTTAPGTSYAYWTHDTVFAPQVVLSDDPTNRPWCGIGDSRLSEGDLGWGNSLSGTSAAGQFYPNSGLFGGYSWFTRGMSLAGKTSFNLGMPSARQDWLNTNTLRTTFRNTVVQYCYGVISENGVNDIDSLDTWQTLATSKMNEAWGYKLRNQPYISTTIEPVTTDTTTNWTTVSGQTVAAGGVTPQRWSFNDWVRAGECVTGELINITTAQITYGTPTAPTVSGSSFTCPAGSSPSKLFSQNSAGVPLFVDIACSVEVNSAGVGCSGGAYDGGFWNPSFGTPLTGTLAAATSVTLVQITGTPTLQQYAGYSLTMTSGAASGQIATVFINDISGNLTLFAQGAAWPGGGAALNGFSTAPAAGDTYILKPVATTDGLHGSTAANIQLMAPYFRTWIGTNLSNNW